MISRLIQVFFRYRWAVLLAAVLVVVAGVASYRQMSIDAYPDISDLMVQVITTYPGRAAEDVERQITVPLEVQLRNVPKVEVVRSRTIFGLSLVQMIFEEGTEQYWARQRVLEKLTNIDLPPGANAQMGPASTAFDEILRYELVSDGTHSLMLQRELNDWLIVPRLLKVAGVSDVSNFGGLSRQFSVTFRPAELNRYGIGVGEVADAVRTNNAAAGGSVLRRGAESFVIRSSGTLENIRQIENIFVKSIGGTPVYLKDLANVEADALPPNGIFAKDRFDEVVEGIVIERRGENASNVLKGVVAAIKEINDSGELPKGLSLRIYYNREELVTSTLETVAHSVTLGITLVVLILLLFLGRPSIAFLVALTIPFSLLFALTLMYLTNIPIGLLSIGAIDFGIIADGAIIVAENIARRLGEATERDGKPNVVQVVLGAILEMERAVFFSVLMVVVAYLPLLSLTRIEGLLFRPMAITMVYALLGSLTFALFVVPVLATYLFRNGYHEWQNPVLTFIRPIYGRMIQFLLAFRWIVAAVVFCFFIGVCVKVAATLGIEFLPYMDEGVIYVRVSYPEGTSLQENHELTKRFREVVKEFPDLDFIAAQSGRNDSGTDPFPPNRLEMMIGPKPREAWTQFRGQPKGVLIAALRKRFQEEFPTVRFNFTQPIIDNVLDDTNGTSANLAIELSGPDPTILAKLADKTVNMLKKIKGAIDISIEQEGPQPQLVIHPDRALCARYNIKIDDVVKLINTALGGDPLGVVYEGERRFDIVAKFDRSSIYSSQAIGQLPILNADGVPIPLSQVAKIELVDGQTMIARGERQTPAHGPHRRRGPRPEGLRRRGGGAIQGRGSRQRRRREIQEPGARLQVRVHRHVPEPAARPVALHDRLADHRAPLARDAAVHLQVVQVRPDPADVPAVRADRRSHRAQGARHESQRFDLRRFRGPVRRVDHGRRPHAPRDHYMAATRHAPARGDPARRPGSHPSDPVGVAGRDARPAPSIAGHRARVRCPAAARDGHRLGPVQLDDADAFRRSGRLRSDVAVGAAAGRRDGTDAAVVTRRGGELPSLPMANPRIAGRRASGLKGRFCQPSAQPWETDVPGRRP